MTKTPTSFVSVTGQKNLPVDCARRILNESFQQGILIVTVINEAFPSSPMVPRSTHLITIVDDYDILVGRGSSLNRFESASQSIRYNIQVVSSLTTVPEVSCANTKLLNYLV